MIVQFRKYDFRLRESKEGIRQIFDVIRKKWLVLTPEEWVRQHWIHFLVFDKQFPVGVFSVESGHKINTRQKRTDIVVFKNQKPILLIECKAHDVKIDQKVLDQAIVYNQTVSAKFIILSNGETNVLLESSSEGIKEINDLPIFSELQ